METLAKYLQRDLFKHTTTSNEQLIKDVLFQPSTAVKSKVKSNIGQAFWRLGMVDLFTPCCTSKLLRK